MTAQPAGPSSTPDAAHHHHPQPESRAALLKLTVGAIGVVYGDIGTSPLYAVKECFSGPHGVAPTLANILGVLSLIFWALTLVIVVKYLSFIMRADNNGEGGILALVALVAPKGPATTNRARTALVMLGLFGASLLYGDGMITPAISVLSAVEGLEVATTALRPFVIPLTVAILIPLFLVQKRGTAGVGAVFGPATLIWFVTIASIGAPWVLRHPGVLAAVNPLHAVRFFAHNQWHGFLVLGSVLLCITGGEALYADMGHFGRRPIRLAWYTVAFPALLTNYFGQGALLIEHGATAASNPFYLLVTGWMRYPLVAIATTATIVASQAMISGAFSITQQAVQLGYSPRVTIVHTSGEAEGQIYIPEINTALMVACVTLVLTFRHSSALAAAYGIAVIGTMTMTSVLFASVARTRWNWSRPAVGAILALFWSVELSFLSASALKIAHGGWFPLAVAALVFTLMTTWKRGRAALADFIRRNTHPLDAFMDSMRMEKPVRVRGTAVFMTQDPAGTPIVLLHHFKHNKVLHEQVVLLSVATDRVPEVPPGRRVEITDKGLGFFQVVAHYGFMQTPNVPEILRCCKAAGLQVVEHDTSFYLGRETLLTTGRSGMMRWRKGLFAFMSRNARPATHYFGIPPNRVVELGTQIEL